MKHTRITAANRLILAGVAALTAVLPAAVSHAQGTRGAVPDPISSRDLTGYAARFALTEEQRGAIDSFHEQYRARFRELRAAEIESLLQQTGRMFAGGFRMLDRPAIEESIKILDRVMSRIRSLDGGFFDDLQTVLTDSQVTELTRVMHSRERQRYATGTTRMMGFINRASRVDLSRLYDELELSEAERRASDPLVASYEVRLTAATRDLYKATTRVFLDVVDALEVQGIDPADFADRESRRQMFQSLADAWAEAFKKPAEKASAIGDLNRRSLRQITEMLSSEAAQRLRSRYLRRAYPEIPRTPRADAGFRAALGIPNLPKATRENVEAASIQFQASRDRLNGEMIKYIDAYRKSFSPMRFRGSGRREHEGKLEAFSARFTELDRATVEALSGLLGPGYARHLESALAAGGPADAQAGEGGPRADSGETLTESDDPWLGPDPFLPPPITARDVSSYRRILGLADDDRFILESLHEDYMVSFSGVRETDVAALHRARAKLQRSPGEGAAPAADQIDEVYDLRKRIVDSIHELDRSFFDDLKILMSNEEQRGIARRLRLARERAVFNRGFDIPRPQSPWRNRRGSGRGGGGRSSPSLERARSQEAGVDVASLLVDLDLADEERTKARTLLGDYERNVTGAFRRHFETMLLLARETEKRSIEARRPNDDSDVEARRQRWRAFGRANTEHNRRMTEAGKPIIELNRAAMAAVSSALPSKADALKSAYNRKAFPAAYNERRSAQRFLSTAMSLDDLSGDQGSRIQAILAEYQPAYEKICGQMAEIYATQPQFTSGFDRDAWRESRERRSKLEVLAFDRTEVNAKALRRLREVLSEKQETRLRLPDDTAPDPQPQRSL